MNNIQQNMFMRGVVADADLDLGLNEATIRVLAPENIDHFILVRHRKSSGFHCIQ
jgi:hypothetical protein